MGELNTGNVEAEGLAWEYAQLTAELSELLWRRTDVRIEIDGALRKSCAHASTRDDMRTQMMERAFGQMCEELRAAGAAWAPALETYVETERF